ncbi:MAG: LTA synthase family protein [Synergistes jonesii]|uniref:LTA synthase family protein n=1 Tax=Synergistes jonesii TaxID=2754 RepID=UPI002A74DC2F|nr:LTA synthase family protein [Synergistes jonesii]MDY2984348.1 LTA synthase family protein [Synergistes jonesii]
MRLPTKDSPLELNGWHFTALLFAAIWLKFFSVDYAIADVLNWPSFGSSSFHVLRHTARALAVCLPSLGAIICLTVPLAFVPKKRCAAALLIFDLLLSALVMTDRLFVRYYGDIFIFHDLLLLPQTGLITKSIWALLKPWDVLIFADIPLLLWLLKSGRLRVVFGETKKVKFRVAATLIIVSVVVQCAACWHLKRFRPNIINAMYDRLSVCAWVSSATFHWWDFVSLSRELLTPKHVPCDTVDEISRWFAGRAARGRPKTRAKNLIFVQCEALQYFAVDLEIDGVPVTPNLNRFKNECYYFPNAWSQAAGGNSADAELMANTGLFPAASGAAYSLYADNDYNSLARAMRARGARAVVVQGTKSAFWNCHRMHPKLWFNKQYSQNSYPDDEAIGLGLSDRVIFGHALEIMRGMRSPFYCFIVTLSSHHPFDFEGIPKDSLPLPDALKDTLIGNYLLSLNYFDRQFGMFVEGLRASGLLDKCVIAVYGDHPAIPAAHKEELERLFGGKIDGAVDWKMTRRVAMMLRTPESAKSPRVYLRNCGQMDILPTVSALLGLNIETTFGSDLLSEKSDEFVVFRNGSYIAGDVFVEPAAGRATDLSTGAAADAKDFSAQTDEAERRLRYNDLILENNLINEIIKR